MFVNISSPGNNESVTTEIRFIPVRRVVKLVLCCSVITAFRNHYLYVTLKVLKFREFKCNIYTVQLVT